MFVFNVQEVGSPAANSRGDQQPDWKQGDKPELEPEPEPERNRLYQTELDQSRLTWSLFFILMYALNRASKMRTPLPTEKFGFIKTKSNVAPVVKLCLQVYDPGV